MMPYSDVYIGELDDPRFSWDEGNWTSNIPRPISPFFPPIKGEDDRPFRALIDRIKKGEYNGKQTAYAGWVARVKKREIKSFAEDMYGALPDLKTRYRSKEIHILFSFIEKIWMMERHIALVASKDWEGLFDSLPDM